MTRKKTGKAKSVVRKQQPASSPKKKKEKKSKVKSVSPVKAMHTVAACSILDPFCPSARGAKRPDGLGAGTMTFQVRSSTAITTNASGSAFVIVVPANGIFGPGIATLAATTWTLPASWTAMPGTTFLSSNASEIRLVSFGVKVTSIASATNCQGVINTFTLTNPIPGNTYGQLYSGYTEFVQTAMTAGFQTSWVAKPVGMKAHHFRPQTELSSTMTDFDWTVLGVEIFGGAASTSIVMLDIVYNVEFTLYNGGVSGVSNLVAPNRPSNPVALAVQSKVHSTMGSFVEGGVKEVEKAVKSAASSALSAIEDYGLAFLGL